MFRKNNLSLKNNVPKISSMRRFTLAACAGLLTLSTLLPGRCGRSEDGVQRYAWPLATASPEDTVTQIFSEKFAEEVSALSDGRMKIQVYANSSLGGDRDLLETCSDGDIPFVVQNTAPQVSFMHDLAVFDLPCAFDSLDDCREKIDDQQFWQLISDVYTGGGYHLLGMADQGFRVMSTNKNVTEFADFKGQKIRTMENSYHLAFWPIRRQCHSVKSTSDCSSTRLMLRKIPTRLSCPTVFTNSRITSWKRIIFRTSSP